MPLGIITCLRFRTSDDAVDSIGWRLARTISKFVCLDSTHEKAIVFCNDCVLPVFSRVFGTPFSRRVSEPFVGVN